MADGTSELMEVCDQGITIETCTRCGHYAHGNELCAATVINQGTHGLEVCVCLGPNRN